MAQNGKSDHKILIVIGAEMPFGGKCVQTAAGMVPYVTFRMPFGILFAAYEPGKLGKVMHPTCTAEKIQSSGHPCAFEQELLPFLHQPFRRKIFDGHLAAQSDSGWMRLESKSRNKLHSAQNAQRILCEFL